MAPRRIGLCLSVTLEVSCVEEGATCEREGMHVLRRGGSRLLEESEMGSVVVGPDPESDRDHMGGLHAARPIGVSWTSAQGDAVNPPSAVNSLPVE